MSLVAVCNYLCDDCLLLYVCQAPTAVDMVDASKSNSDPNVVESVMYDCL